MVVIKKDYLIKILNKIKKGIRGYQDGHILRGGKGTQLRDQRGVQRFFHQRFAGAAVHDLSAVTETNNDKMNIELEFMVNNGAIGDIRVLDYRMGKLK